jgi:starch phosphorylase
VYAPSRLDESLAKVFDAIEQGMFGKAEQFTALIEAIVDHGDYYLVSDDFASYVKTQDLIDASFRDREEWVTKCITSVARMGFFSSDRCIEEYAEAIWNVEQLAPPEEA